MRILFSVLGLLLVVMVIGIVARQQLKAVNQPLDLPGATRAGASTSAPSPAALAQNPQSAASQVRQSVDAMLQQPRPALEEK